MSQNSFIQVLSEANMSTGYLLPASVLEELNNHIPLEVKIGLEKQIFSFGKCAEYTISPVRNYPPAGAFEVNCSNCGGNNVVKDAFVTWDINEQDYTVSSTYDNYFCQDCDNTVAVIETPLFTLKES